MPYNVLFPFRSDSTRNDFSDAAGQGWVEATGNVLKEMTQQMCRGDIDNADNNNDSSIMSIPSPIAHVMDFVKKLRDGNENAIWEWRGMLAAIALQELNGIQIDIREYTICARDGSDGHFRRIVGDAFKKNASITGYSDELENEGKVDLNKLYVFSKDGHPFAMYLPSIIICPFKEYDKTIFKNLPWCDQDGNWTDVLKCSELGCDQPERDFDALNDRAKKLYFWLDGITNNIDITAVCRSAVDGFKNGIYRPGDRADNAPKPKDDLKLWPAANNFNVYNGLKKICNVPDWVPKNACSDRLLLLIPCDDAEFENGDDGLSFVPKKVSLDRERNAYVIPPITEDVVKSLNQGARIAAENGEGWNITYDSANKFFHFQFKLVKDDVIMSYNSYYSADKEVYWISDLPYISMWPNVKFEKDYWRNYLVSIFMRRQQTEVWSDYQRNSARVEWVNEYGFKDNQLLGEKVEKEDQKPAISIRVISNDGFSEIFDCKSRCTLGFEENDQDHQNFRMIRSNSAPEALAFEYNNKNCGCWMMKWGDTTFVDPNKSAIIGMDFGTTSTNVYMKIGDDSPKSISSPAKYVRDIYKPCNDDGKKLFQRYYLFGAEDNVDEKLGKIFTYGQNFSVENVGDSIFPNITGRFVNVDNQYIVANGREDDEQIFSGLKWSLDDTQRNLARKNFVNSILMFAILEARAKGASKIKVRLSYPAQNLGNSISSSLQKELLKEYNGIGLLDFKGSTEARCAGKYYEITAMGNRAILPEIGYSIIDIGGGTTDVSFMQDTAPNNQTESCIKAEHTFTIAGSQIIEKTFIDFFDKNPDKFDSFWSGNDPSVSIAKERFRNLVLENADADEVNAQTLEKHYREKGAVLNFLLENCDVKAESYSKDDYRKLFQAIRTKYYILFWLIAQFLKKNENVEINPKNRISVCLAGCGAKGYRMCVESLGNNRENVDNNIAKAYVPFLGIGSEIKAMKENGEKLDFRLVLPLKNNKEEVAYGLCLLDDGDTNDIENVDAALANQAFNGDGDNYDDIYDISDPDEEVTNEDISEDNDNFAQAPVAEEPTFIAPDDTELKRSTTNLLNLISKLEKSKHEDGKPNLFDGLSGSFEEYFSQKSVDIKKKVKKVENDGQVLYEKVFSAYMLYAMIDEELKK